ncbi:hypothetical protein [Novipirellula rosea]|uniref:Uncharacterized protein n=1 Tax=Novipirellula rosea TaxID=1031540 RepID=A0ABP8MST2_9BACT
MVRLMWLAEMQGGDRESVLRDLPLTLAVRRLYDSDPERISYLMRTSRKVFVMSIGLPASASTVRFEPSQSSRTEPEEVTL